jgi:peptidoglycan hydrolase CwlO-like protein
MEKELSARAAESETLKKQLAALNQSNGEKLTAVSTERDNVLAELETARHEIAEKVKEIETQQNLAARSREDVTKAAAERDALRQELADRVSKLGALTSELATLKSENDEKLAALAQERDAILQQKSGLAEQLAAATESLATRQKDRGRSGTFEEGESAADRRTPAAYHGVREQPEGKLRRS